MHKGFLFTVMTFMMLSALITLSVDFNQRQADHLEIISQESSGYHMHQVWSDISESLPDITELNVTVNDNVITIDDNLPKEHETSTLLQNYGRFIENVYEPSNLDISFISQGGDQIQLDDMPSYLEISPYGAVYDYPDYGHNELLVSIPNENFTELDSIEIDLYITNKNITETEWKWAPYKSCSGDDCIELHFTLRDNYTSYTYPETMFSRSKQSATSASLDGAGWVEIIVGTGDGETQNLLEVVLHNAHAESSTTLLLNTTEFSVLYPVKLSIEDLNRNISKVDWLK